MTTSFPVRIAVLAAAVAAMSMAGCTSTDTSGGGNSPRGSRGGGWENFRAEAPAEPAIARTALALAT